MSITQFTETNIILEGDSVTQVDEVVVIESIVLFTEDEVEEYTPMFAQFIAHEETVVIPEPFTFAPIYNMEGNQIWLC